MKLGLSPWQLPANLHQWGLRGDCWKGRKRSPPPGSCSPAPTIQFEPIKTVPLSQLILYNFFFSFYFSRQRMKHGFVMNENRLSCIVAVLPGEERGVERSIFYELIRRLAETMVTSASTFVNCFVLSSAVRNWIIAFHLRLASRPSARNVVVSSYSFIETRVPSYKLILFILFGDVT